MDKLYILYYIAAGLLGGVAAGMGMGGGTLTMPILALALGVGQLTAQFANLLAFLPSGGCALMMHSANGLVDMRAALRLLLPSVIGCAAASFFAVSADAAALKRLFGGFLIVVAVASLFTKTLKKV